MKISTPLTAMAISLLLAAPQASAGSAIADLASSTASPSRSFRFRYEVRVTPPPGASKAAVWIPLPTHAPEQKIEDLRIEANVPYKISSERTFGNRMAYFERNEAPVAPIRASVVFRVTRYEYGGRQAQQPPSRYLAANKLVPTSGLIRHRAEKITAELPDTMSKARALYDYVTDTVHYDKSGTGWGRGDAMFACTEKKGNCTDFHALFIAMARSVGIPARFEIGFPLPRDASGGAIGGYHCWAEFWIEGRGWIPVDASEASKHPERRDYLFGKLDPDRVLFTSGRDILLSPRQRGDALNYFVYPYVEFDDKPLSDKSLVDLSFSFEDTAVEASR